MNTVDRGNDASGHGSRAVTMHEHNARMVPLPVTGQDSITSGYYALGAGSAATTGQMPGIRTQKLNPCLYIVFKHVVIDTGGSTGCAGAIAQLRSDLLAAFNKYWGNGWKRCKCPNPDKGNKDCLMKFVLMFDDEPNPVAPVSNPHRVRFYCGPDTPEGRRATGWPHEDPYAFTNADEIVLPWYDGHVEGPTGPYVPGRGFPVGSITLPRDQGWAHEIGHSLGYVGGLTWNEHGIPLGFRVGLNGGFAVAEGWREEDFRRWVGTLMAEGGFGGAAQPTTLEICRIAASIGICTDYEKLCCAKPASRPAPATKPGGGSGGSTAGGSQPQGGTTPPGGGGGPPRPGLRSGLYS